ncbi:MAG: type II secretion system F family protein [Deltaproteobacteria bacterium]|nr:type II secretion system F family protein [Deltaproteobacteria bacterium]
MTLYSYKARDPQGKELQGQLEADGFNSVQSKLLEQGLFPFNIQEVSKASSSILLKLFGRSKRFKPKHLATFTKQFELLFRVGMPVDQIIKTISFRAQDPGFKAALENIQRSLSSGSRLAEAFSLYPEYFPKIYISMLELGQSSGILDKTLHEMAIILEKESQMGSKIKMAMLYPKIVLFTLAVVTWAMLVFVFPRFASFYTGHDRELPLPTKIVMGASDFLSNYGLLFFLAILAIYVGWKRVRDWPKIQYWISRVAIKIPVFGKLNRLSSNARFAYLVSSLYRIGLPLPQALSVVAGTIPNLCYQEEIRKLKQKVEHGQSLHDGMESLEFFTPMIKETCAIGEHTGKLDVTLGSTGQFHDDEVNEMLNNLSTLIEPIMLFGIFGVVFLLALAVYLPMWNLSSVVLQ